MEIPPDDSELLERYVGSGDTAAFAELVRRHLDLVYSAAARRVGDRHLAEDVTQVVFVILARKPRSARSSASFVAWLLITVRYAAATALKTERRRRRHERSAAECLGADRGAASGNPADVLIWQELAGHLDDAVLRLPAQDRQLVLLRFFERKPMRDVASIMDVTEPAARQRLSRALDKLRTRLADRVGTAALAPTGATGLAALLTSHAVRAASPALSQVAWVGSTAAAGGTAGAAATGGLAIAKGAMAMMTYANVKALAVGVTVAIVLATGAAFTLNHAFGQSRDTTSPGAAAYAAVAARSRTSTAPSAAVPAAEAVSPSPFTAKLENGVSVELLGLIRGKVVKRWWLPDGTPDDHPILAKARFDRTKVIHAPEERDPRPSVGVVVRFNLKMRDGSLATSVSEQWFCTALDSQDKPLKDLVVLYGMGKQRAKTDNVLFRFATGPWEPTDVRATAEELGGTKGEIRYGKAESLRDGTYVGLFVDNDRWTTIAGRGAKRLCARDAGDKTHVAIPFQGRFPGDGPPEPLELGYLFTDLAPTDLKEVWLERRTVDKWIEFRDVSFDPEVKTEVRVVTSDDPPDDTGGL